MSKSPYLSPEGRLADVIAAIQAMGTYKIYKLDFRGWSDRISGSEENEDHWREVFEQHPEFFRLDSTKSKASLVVRRQHPKRYNIDTQEIISYDSYLKLREEDPNKFERISRTPLQPEEISVLIDVAIQMHSRAVDGERLKYWWIPLASALFAFIGSLIGVFASQLGVSQ